MKRRMLKRRLRCESLTKRVLLAGDLEALDTFDGVSMDVNNDGEVTPHDALLVANTINGTSSHAADFNQDQTVDEADFAIGAWDVLQSQAADMELTLAFAPGQEELRAAVLERIVPIVEYELELFGTTPQEKYLFLFGESSMRGYGGSPKSSSMTLFVSPELPVSFATQGVEYLIAHEFHHTWMKARCQPEDELRFVIEGYTDYYAHLVPWRLELQDDAKLLSSLRGKLSELEGAQGDISLTAAGGPIFFEGGTPTARSTPAGWSRRC